MLFESVATCAWLWRYFGRNRLKLPSESPFKNYYRKVFPKKGQEYD